MEAEEDWGLRFRGQSAEEPEEDWGDSHQGELKRAEGAEGAEEREVTSCRVQGAGKECGAASEQIPACMV